MQKILFSVLTLILILLVVSAAQPAYADTDGTEPKFTEQAEQLILQLGTKWAGVEFELKTDAGVFPTPIVVDQNGLLTMDIGGSKTYVLSCLSSTITIPDPNQTDVAGEPTTQDEGNGTPQDEGEGNEPAPKKESIPVLTIVLYGAGLLVVVGALIAVTKMKSRVQYENDEDYGDYEDDDE